MDLNDGADDVIAGRTAFIGSSLEIGFTKTNSKILAVV